MNITLPNINPVLNELKQELQELYGERLAYITLYGSQARNVNLTNEQLVQRILKDEFFIWTSTFNAIVRLIDGLDKAKIK